MKIRVPRRYAASGFTLMEIVLSSALMALILTSAYVCLRAGFLSQKEMEPRLEALQNARVAMALMTADLRAACPLSQDNEFVGMPRQIGEAEADNLDFATHNYTPRRAREGDFCQASYYLGQDAETGDFVLMRRRNPSIAPDPFSGGAREEIARGLAGLKFEYFDGVDWYSSWGSTKSASKQQASNKQASNEQGLPEAVRITLWMNPEPGKRREPAEASQTKRTPLEFQTVVMLNLADAAQRYSGANAGSDAGNAAMPGQGGGM